MYILFFGSIGKEVYL